MLDCLHVIFSAEARLGANLPRPEMTAVNVVNQLLHIACLFEIDECIAAGQTLRVTRYNNLLDRNELAAECLNLVQVSIIW